ncbi:YaaA family protein [Sulfurimonas sp. HSL3-7]|uniref:YaaA family protein n=1 Tax=Sulfonitrofixus jiaomeiensis TaxID=3131938 RepID=UPI0031F9CBA5
MLYTLFSPSEGKLPGGDSSQQSNILFGYAPRNEILLTYNTIVNSGDMDAIKALFGIKKESDIQPYLNDLFKAPKMAAIERYSGVAYDYLDYASLAPEAKAYLREQVIIFSNLYGPVLGGDKIANYKVKQGNSIGGIAPDKFYKDRFSYQLDLLLMEHEILDLRAGYYDKFYKTKQPYTTLKFLKDGKTVSHWAKAYRGLVLRELAQHQINNLDAFMKMEIETLKVEEIREIKNKKEIVYSIIG